VPDLAVHRNDTELLVHAVREAGVIARKFFRGDYRRWDKGHGNPVTEADIAIDRFLHDTLLSARPSYGWLSEETEDDPARLSKSHVFVVDPIDGTVGFLKGRPHFTIVAAIVERGRPVSAAIYNPVSDEMYEASVGGGALKNGTAIQVSDKDTFDGALVLAPNVTFEAQFWKTPWPASMKTETRASIAYRLALVGEGAFDAMISLSAKHDWDLAAGDLVLHEAGGRVTSPDGALLTYNNTQPLQSGVLAAGAKLHERLVERMNAYLN